MSRPRVLIVNHWHDDNRGDSAITQGILHLLLAAWPDACVTLAGMTEAGPIWDRSTLLVRREFPAVQMIPSLVPTQWRAADTASTRMKGLWAALVWLVRLIPTFVGVVTGRSRGRLAKFVSEADLVIAVGGSNIYDDPSVSPVLSLARLLAVAAPIRVAVRSGTPVLLLGHTMGPFPRDRGRRFARRLIAGADVLVVRESTSLPDAEYLKAKLVEVAPDMAFAIEPTITAAVDSELARLSGPPHRMLGISLRQHPSLGDDANKRLLGEVSVAVRELFAAGRIDGVVAVAHTVGPIPIEDDRPITAEFANLLGEIPVVVIESDLSPGELAALYGALGVVVAVRLHAAILALTSGTPVFAISYFSAKTLGVMAGVGLSDAVADFATVTSREIVDGVGRLSGDEVRQRLREGSETRRIDLGTRAAQWFSVIDHSSFKEVVPS